VEQSSGITIFGAATSVQSLIFKRLLDRRSDLLATGNLFLIIQTYDYMAPLPSDFLSMAEKPKAVEVPVAAASVTYIADGLYLADGTIYAGSDVVMPWVTLTAWMAGTVVSYDPVTKTLILNVTSTNGSGSIASWHIAVGTLPGQPIYPVDTSASLVAVGTGSKTLVTATALSLLPGQNVIISNVALPGDTGVYSSMDPITLDEDDHEDFNWWSDYCIDSDRSVSSPIRPRRYKIISTNFYVSPKVAGPVMVTGRYNAKPAALTAATDTIPWNGFFDETIKEGVVRILLKGIAIPDADPDINGLVQRDIDTILGSRVRILPRTGRIRRSSYM
jgi:hypothetical protein